MTCSGFCYVLFTSTHEGLRLEKILRERGVNFTIVLTPRQLSTCCGIAIRFPEDLWEKVPAAIEENMVAIEGITGSSRHQVPLPPKAGMSRGV